MISKLEMCSQLGGISVKTFNTRLRQGWLVDEVYEAYRLDGKRRLNLDNFVRFSRQDFDDAAELRNGLISVCCATEQNLKKLLLDMHKEALSQHKKPWELLGCTREVYCALVITNAFEFAHILLTIDIADIFNEEIFND